MQAIIFTIRWAHWPRIWGLLLLLTAMSILILLFPRSVYSYTKLSIDGGLGNFEIKTKDDKFISDSKNSRRNISLRIDFEKDEHPLRFSFRLGFFNTGEDSEKWTKALPHENRLQIHGENFDVLGFFTIYNFASSKGAIRLKPFIGGGLGYKRFKFERNGLDENIITPPAAGQYFLGNQDVTAIGATPHIGFLVEIPKFKLECNVIVGWSLLAVRSNVNYHYFSGSDEVMHSVIINTSGSSLVTGIQVVRSWESFSIVLGYIWEKTWIDDKLLVKVKKIKLPDESPYDTYNRYFYFPFPEFEMIQTIGQISLTYLF